MAQRVRTLAELSIKRQMRGVRRAAFRDWWNSRVSVGRHWANIPVTAAVLLSLLAWRLLA
jgi:hypothetical protein